VLRSLPIAWRITLLVLLGAGVVLAVVSIVSYTSARDVLEREKQAEFAAASEATANRIDVVGRSVEKVTEGLAVTVQDAEPGPARARALLRGTVRANEELFAAGIGYDPGTYGDRAPYAYDPSGRYGDTSGDNGGAGQVKVTDLGRDGGAYTLSDWYQLPYQMHRAVWTEPYYQQGGGDVVCATYAVPIRFRESATPVSAVVTGEISLIWLRQLLQDIDLGDSGYAFLISKTGTFIAHPDPSFIMNESVFSVAAARHDPSLRAIGQKMIAGASGYVAFDGIRTMQSDEPSWLAYRPVASTGWSLGIVVADSEISSDVVALNRTQWGIALIGIAALLFIALFIAGSITRPIRSLDAATHTLAQGDLGAPLPKAKGRDEIARLTTSFSQMRDDLERHIGELRESTAAQERMHSELRIAAGIQMDLVPRTFPPFPDRNDLDLFATLVPAREVGGDFYDFVEVDGYRLSPAVADVSGKGVPAALLMAVGRSFLRSFVRDGGSPAEVLRQLNEEIAAENEASMFITMFLALADLRTGEVRYASAGHNPPFIITADGRAAQVPRVRGVALGARQGMAYDEGSFTMAPDDVLFLYTDGVSEAMDAEDAMFTETRIGEVLAPVVAGGASCEVVVEHLLAAVRRHADGVEQFDDVTMLAFRYLGPSPGGEGSS
jgi:sigma-B regulation protein RsbU (phosphoserine phosphatase)